MNFLIFLKLCLIYKNAITSKYCFTFTSPSCKHEFPNFFKHMSYLQKRNYFGVLFCIDKGITHMHLEVHATSLVLMCRYNPHLPRGAVKSTRLKDCHWTRAVTEPHMCVCVCVCVCARG